MGAPGWTSFCKNGHIVEICAHHEIIMDQKFDCLICGATVIGIQIEWGDPDYESVVSREPIDWDEIKVIEESKYGKHEYVRQIPIYDVSKLVK
jgi:hypothetical protein